MDHITCLPKIDRGVDAIATFIDHLSKYAYFIPAITSISVDNLAQVFLLIVVARHRVPQHLILDHDPRFVSAFWKGLMSALGAQVTLSTIYHPQPNGQSKQQHHDLEQIFRCFIGPRQHDWDLLLPSTEFSLSSSCSALTVFSPAYMLYGRKPNFPLEVAVCSVTDSHVAFVLEHIVCMSDVVQSVRRTLAQTADSIIKQANCKHCDVEVCVRDLVWISTGHLQLLANLSFKSALRFSGPFRVLEIVTPVSFCLNLPTRWYIHPVFHVSQLKQAVGVSADLPSNQMYSPPLNESCEFKVEDILDVQVSRSGLCVFRILWKGYSLFESMWELEPHLKISPDILPEFCHCRNLPLRATASLEGE